MPPPPPPQTRTGRREPDDADFEDEQLTTYRSWLPLLFIPTNASPSFIFLFFVCTYFLNRPCVYCSILLLILFCTSCNWADRCFFDFSSDWFRPRPPVGCHDGCDNNSSSGGDFNSTLVDMFNTTAKALASAAAGEVQTRTEEWTGIGVGWLRTLLGRREWSVDCLDLKIRL